MKYIFLIAFIILIFSGCSTTFMDTKTGLMWQVEPALRGNPKYKNMKGMKFDSAVRYCKRLELDGYYDWRLPRIDELYSIIDLDAESHQYYETGREEKRAKAYIKDQLTSVTESVRNYGRCYYYWSSTNVKNDKALAMSYSDTYYKHHKSDDEVICNLGSGVAEKKMNNFVRCVRNLKE